MPVEISDDGTPDFGGPCPDDPPQTPTPTKPPVKSPSLLPVFLLVALAMSVTACRTVPTRPVAAPWLPDQGDGTYRNPVLFADYSDPDVVRVGDDYYLTASSFMHAPGLPILHSRDLVNWTIINHVFAVQSPLEHFAKPRHGQGVWAPAIRHYGGKFWIFYPDPDFGLYVTTATGRSPSSS